VSPELIKTPKTASKTPQQDGTMPKVSTADLKKLTDEKVAAEKTADSLVVANEGLNADVEDLTGAVTELTAENNEFRKDNANLNKHLKAAMTALKATGNHSTMEESKTVKNKIHAYVKEHGFREWKFIKSDVPKKAFVDEIYNNIAEALGMTDLESDFYCSKENFHRIYTGVSVKKLGDRRQLTQTMMLKAALSTYDILFLRHKNSA
jgi:regulator of replication initiation timing